MKENNVIDLAGRETGRDALTELLRDGARTLIAQALEAELGELLKQFEGSQDDQGRALVVPTVTSRNARFRQALVL